MDSPADTARAGQLFSGPVGRRVVASMAGVELLALLDELGIAWPPNVGRLTSAGSRPRPAARRRHRPGLRILADPLHRRDRAHEGARDAHRAGVAGAEGADAAAAIRRLVSARPRRADPATTLTIMKLLAATIVGVGFWGNEPEEDALLQAGIDELRPAALELAASEAASWWWDDLVRADQRCVTARPTTGRGAPPPGAQLSLQLTQGSEELRRREAEARRRHPIPSAVAEATSGDWWSVPLPALFTTRAVPPLPALALGCAEDPGEREPVDVWALQVPADARVVEIRQASDWGHLVEEAPVDVTASRMADWRRWTGEDGPFYLPDFAALADRYDLVHLTVGGYLATRSVAVPVCDGSSLLAGWDPDSTLWLRAVADEVRHIGEWQGPRGPGAWTQED